MRYSVNEYTRREEVRWILVSAVVLVSSVAASLGLLLTARGPVVADPQALAVSQGLELEAQELAACAETAAALRKEITVFRDVAADSKVLEHQPDRAPDPPPEEPRGPKAPKDKPKPKPRTPDFSAQAWPAAKSTFERATRLVPCQAIAERAAPADPKAAEAWRAVNAVASVKPPADGDGPASLTSARQVFAAVEKAPVEALVEHTLAASKALAAQSAEAKERAATAVVQEPLSKGVLGREAAIAAGVLVSLVALLVSFFSLRATSVRRASALAPYRKAVRPPERGLQAATILRLASEPNGGEPGIVLGAGLGGLLAALLFGRTDADWYVGGVAGGLVVGLVVQTLLKSIGLTKHFRERALAIAEIEKPAVPIVLVLSTIRPGLEATFLSFFLKLSPTEAANAVEKLATQAEDQILIAADAHALS